MVCPICITTALVANAPAIAASLGGAAAVKFCLNRNQAQAMAPKQPQQAARREPVRPMIDPMRINRYDEEEW
ncbi:hypothetical protein GPECTOR_176g226 [Gonium pectorale]|uniref:Uncharacterized protein n=1 Tax=Gonium pectorale TaxID=33097 RepID=A0A150FYG6_GONPE|nr:hypothetical protein GPECTOR_176g226 [Gonium pectorale]|eukprot:KXZ42245.1 hypothetical protein GPECTOR_176g226 [Gonium pectorale]